MHTPAHKSGTAAQTLSDYIKDVVESEKRLEKEKPRLTFDEWLATKEAVYESNYSCFGEYGGQVYTLMEQAWEASRENM